MKRLGNLERVENKGSVVRSGCFSAVQRGLDEVCRPFGVVRSALKGALRTLTGIFTQALSAEAPVYHPPNSFSRASHLAYSLV